MKTLARMVIYAIPLSIAIAAVLVRWVLFSSGRLYGETASKMAGLVIAGIIITAGAVSLVLLSGREEDSSLLSRESIIAVLSGALGLATAAYGTGELFAPNTPVAATAAACDGAPVYGAHFFALTQEIGANSRLGAGRQYAQANRYGGKCTLGFDGYCIGPAEPDFALKTPDQRWLIVHKRDELVASAVVLSQSPEAKLGSSPSPRCAKLGGRAQPSRVQGFSYDVIGGRLSSSATGAVGVGYGLTAVSGIGQVYAPIALGRGAEFPAKLPSASVAERLGMTNGSVLLGAAVCLADNVPVVNSLNVKILTLRDSKVVKVAQGTAPSALRAHLAGIACNSSG